MDWIYLKQLSFQLLGLACLRCRWCSCTCVGLHIVSPGIPKAGALRSTRSTFSKPGKPATVLPCSVSRLLRINQRLLEAAMRICDRWANGYVPFFRTGCEMTKKKKQIRPCCSSSTNRVANLRPPQPHKKKLSVWLWVTATQHLDCALHICGISKLLAEYALDLAQHEFWIKYDLQRINIAMGSQWTWLQLSLFSVGFGSFPVSQKRPVESWTEGLAVLVKLCKACAGAGTGGVWMQSSAKCRN